MPIIGNINAAKGAPARDVIVSSPKFCASGMVSKTSTAAATKQIANTLNQSNLFKVKPPIKRPTAKDPAKMLDICMARELER